MEKMVNVRLMWYLESGNFLTPVQYGFRKIRSTSDALISLQSSNYWELDSDNHQVRAFFGLEKAYGTSWCHGLLLSLYNFDLRDRLHLFIRQYLSHNLLQVRVGNVLFEACPLENGVPQGSILSVTLFAVAIKCYKCPP